MDNLEEIRSRLDIVDLVSQYVQLKKVGSNYKGLCPFHNEKTPSFIVSPDKGIAYCFGCHKGGDIFKFIQLIDNIEFKEAVRLLADKTGIKLKSEFKTQKNKKAIQNINESASLFFEQQLNKNPIKKKYITDRQVSNETLKIFKIGFAPDSYNQTYSHLLKEKYTHKEILDAGLAVAKNLTELKIYDRFRNRIMFPITNTQGQVIAFGGRSLDEKDTAKYLNSPESVYYNKSYSLYGLSQAKESIKKENFVIIVEGYMDVISSYQIGVKNVVAASGTALTIQQIKTLKRYTPNFYLSFDNDEAGFQAIKRAIELCIPNEINLKIVQIVNAKDPDEYINKHGKKWKNTVQNAINFLDYFFIHTNKKYNKNTLEGQKKITSELLKLIKIIPNSIEQNFYSKKIAEYLNIPLKNIIDEINKIKKNKYKTQTESNIVTNSKQYSPEEYLLGIIINYPHLAEIVTKKIIDQLFIKPKIKSIYKTIEKIYNLSGTKTSLNALKIVPHDQKEEISILTVYLEEKYHGFSEKALGKEIVRFIAVINQNNFKEMKANLIKQLKLSQNTTDEKKIILNKLNEMLKIKINN